MKRVLQAYLDAAGTGADHGGAVVAAAQAVADAPWDVVAKAGCLARGQQVVATRDIGLTEALRVVSPTHRQAVVRVEQGQPYPGLDRHGRRKKGAFDTPRDMARRVVQTTVAACEGRPQRGLDPACGTGAFLVAMDEAGIPEIVGTDLDPVALAVAQVAVPRAQLALRDGFLPGEPVDVLCGNPPYVPPERQSKAHRAELRRRFPWLRGRFDLVIPFCAAAVERTRRGGGLGLVLPSAALVQPYGAELRRAWLTAHRIVALSQPEPFPGASVEVVQLVLRVGAEPAPLPGNGVQPSELLQLTNAPLNPKLRPGDVALAQRIRSDSVPLGSLAIVDTGVVAHGPDGGKARLLHDQPGPGRVPFADAKGFFSGVRRWLDYDPSRMHRAKTPALFEGPKIVIQRLRGRGALRAAVDRSGLYLGHTCTVVVPRPDCPPLEPLLDWIRSPVVTAITRIERGERLDFYPRDVASIPVPKAWLRERNCAPIEALGLSVKEMARLEELGKG